MIEDETGTPLVLPDRDTGAESAGETPVDAPGLVLVARDENIGAVVLARRARGAWTSEDAALLSILFNLLNF